MGTDPTLSATEEYCESPLVVVVVAPPESSSERLMTTGLGEGGGPPSPDFRNEEERVGGT